MPVMRVGSLRWPRRPSCGTRPVVASSESGSATSIPVISRPSETALTAARASWSAVAAPAETPSSVAVVRIMSGTCGFRPSTTPTTTVSVPRPDCSSTSPIGDEHPQVFRPFRRCGRRGAGGSQRGRDRRVLLRCDDQGSGDPLGRRQRPPAGDRGRGLRDRRKETGQ